MKEVDLIITCLAREIKEGEKVLTGVASPLPMLAIQLARKLWAPNLTYFNCIGAVDPVIHPPFPPSSESSSVLKDKNSFMELAQSWDLAQKGMLDLMFFSAGQIDQVGNVNLTGIGDYRKPKVKFPGPAGSTTLRSLVRRSIIFTLKHNPRTFVPKVDFITSQATEETRVITNLGILSLSAASARIISLHPGIKAEAVVKNTGFPLQILAEVEETVPPGEKELKIINELDPTGQRYQF